MVSTLNRQEKFNQVRRNFCFYLDIQEHGLARSISRRLQDMGLQQEVVLSGRVTHVVRSGRGAAPWRREGRARADAMLERVRCAPAARQYVLLTVDKAISLLDKLYDTFFTAPRKANVQLFSKPFIKIEFLDKKCRPLYKEFDEWPEFSLEPNPPKAEKVKAEPVPCAGADDYHNTTHILEMTRKNRLRIKEKEKEDEARGGYCEACGASYTSRAAHTRSPRHAAFARHAHNYLALDALIRRPHNGALNGHPRHPPHPPHPHPPHPRRARRAPPADAYYKVVGVSTKLRSSGGFAPKPKEAEPACNGAEPLVVKFRKVRRSELSVLSDEAEQFMFPKRAGSGGSSSSGDEEEEKEPPRPALERRRQARPLALKEESSEEDSWLDDRRRRKRRAPPAARGRRRGPAPAPESSPTPAPSPAPAPALAPASPPASAPSLPPAEPSPPAPAPAPRADTCVKWEGGRLTYTPAVDRLEFAFESVPRSEPWYDAFARQDEDRVAIRDVPRCFALYSKSPKLPYEMSQLPPLKPNCCALSSLPRREPRAAGPARYGTRGLQSRLHRRVAEAAQEARPRKSPREHASTLAMLGSAGLRRAPDDAKSTASEDTAGERPEPAPSAAQQASERLQRFLAEVFDDGEFEPPDEGAALASRAPPDVLGLVADCDGCDVIRRELAEAAGAPRARRRGRFKKKNRTGWPNKKKTAKKDSRAGSSSERKTESSPDRSSADSRGTVARDAADEPSEPEPEPERARSTDEAPADKPLRLDVKVLLEDEKAAAKGAGAAEAEERASEERARRRKRALGGLGGLGGWLQPVVRVARVDPAAARRLRSARRLR